MADYYIDTNGSGTSPYDSWAKAANTKELAQTVLDTVVAGETVHARGSLILTATLDIDQHEGDKTGGFIKFIGYNAAGVNDGTRFVIDGNNAATDVLKNSSMNRWWFENIECKNSNGGDGFEGVGALYNVFLNCCANNNDVMGFSTYNFQHSIYIRCVAYSNTADGFGNSRSGQLYLFCRSRDNGQSGFDLNWLSGTCIGCIADHNGNDGYENLGYNAYLFNSIADHNTDDGCFLRTTGELSLLVGCRITNHSGVGDIGINANSSILLHGWNYYDGNDGNNVQNAALAYELLYNGASTVLEDQGDTEKGYTDEDDPEDYNLRADATLRRTAIQIPLS